MPSVKGKGNGGDMRAKAALNGKKVGRPKTHIAVRLPIETAAQAQRLMLYHWPGVATVEDLIAYAVRKLAETTDD